MRGVEQIPWVYDAMCWLMELQGLGRWRRWLAQGARGRTLDLGCGTGRNLPLVPAGTRVVAVDPSDDALRRAARRAPGVMLVRARAEALPFRAGTFDTVLVGLVLCSVDSPDAAIGEVERVLATGGEARVLEHVRPEGEITGRVADAIQPAWTKVAGGCRPNRRTEMAVKSGGFEIDPASRRASGSMRRFVARPGQRSKR